MHTLTPRLEQALRAHGLGEPELDELLRAGLVERGDSHGGSNVLRIDGNGGSDVSAPASRVTLDGMPLTADSPDDLLDRLRAFPALDATPELVTVSGTDATTDTAITMLEGATGARIPTGQHRRSGAMPDAVSAPRRGSNAIAVVVLALAAAMLVAIAAFLFAR